MLSLSALTEILDGLTRSDNKAKGVAKDGSLPIWI